MREVTKYFSTLLYRNELPGWIKKIDEITQDITFENYEENSLVLQTRNMINNEKLDFFISYIKGEAENILKTQGYNTNDYSFHVNNLWMQIFLPKGFNLPHVHSGCQMSGLYFFDIPDKDVIDLIIHDPRPGKLTSELTPYEDGKLKDSTSIICIDPPTSGTLLMFNSWLSHNLINNSNSHRVKFLHFNIISMPKL